MFKKRLLVAALALVQVFALTACGDGELKEGPLTITGASRKGMSPEFAMDNDLTTGWVGRKRAKADACQELKIDLGKETTFSKITLDDSFAGGLTNKPAEYEQELVVIDKNSKSSMLDGTSVVNLLQGTADGQSWISENIPTVDAPEYVAFSLMETVEVKKLEFNNEMNNSVSEHFEVYYSSETLGRKDLSDITKYTKLFEVTDNEETIYSYIPEEKVTVGSLYVKFYKQTSEEEACVASLDEVFFYVEPQASAETHQPIHFIMMHSKDGKTYEQFLEEKANYDVVYQKTLDAPITCRFIKYLVFEENGNNYPSIGELILE